MSIATVLVSGQLYNPDGTPAANTPVRFTLSGLGVIGLSLLVPRFAAGASDADGWLSMPVVPSPPGTYYDVRADAQGALLFKFRAVVPASDCQLSQIMQALPYPPIDASEQALIDLQAAQAEIEADRQAAAASAGSAAQNATQTGEDVIQTGDARIATGEDRTATGQDLEQTGEDRLATGQDRIATGEDRLQTGEDRTAVAQDLLQAGRDVMATSEDRIATGEDRTATGQDRIATGEDRLQTDEDRTATGQDRAAALESRQAAWDSAYAAAQSAVAAAQSALDTLALFGSSQAVAIAVAAAAASRDAAAVSAALSGNSANLAADNTLSQLIAVKVQTEAARDAALAGLGAADQSANLAQLLQAAAYNTDIAGQLYREIYQADQADNKTLTVVLERMLSHTTLALDLAGAAARQVGGGNVQLAPGTTAEPTLWAAGDRDTGLMFPAANVQALVTAGLERLRVDAAGNVGIGTNAPSGLLDVNDNRLRVRTAKTPGAANAAGNAGEVCWDAGFIYVAVANNQWKRAALATW